MIVASLIAIFNHTHSRINKSIIIVIVVVLRSQDKSYENAIIENDNNI